MPFPRRWCSADPHKPADRGNDPALLRDNDGPAVVASAVEELLRYLTVLHDGRRRAVLEDVELDRHIFKTGEGIIFPNDLANRDEDAFTDGDRLNLKRNARPHVAFGFGVHQCLGQPLAPMELQVVYSTLYRRTPTLALAVDIDDLRCIASGQCVMAAMDVFDQRDEDGIAVLLAEDPDPEDIDGVREAAIVCPALAIELQD